MDRDRLKKMGKKSCFFVYKSGDADVEKKNPEINFVKALSAVCAVLLWRNAFLSVFDLEALANQIGRKEIIFAEIAVSFAVFILLIAAFKVRRHARENFRRHGRRGCWFLPRYCMECAVQWKDAKLNRFFVHLF